MKVHYRNRRTNHVRPECRLSARQASVCPQCGRHMLPLDGGVPKKTDKRGWSDLIKKTFPTMTFPRDKIAIIVTTGTCDDFKACVLSHVRQGVLGVL
jgi:hypothetical protein